MKVSIKALALIGLLSSVSFAGQYIEDLSVAHPDEKTTDGNGRWVFDDDITLAVPGTTMIVDPAGKQSSYPVCNAVGTDCNPFQADHVYGKIAIKGYIPGTTGWGQWAGGGLILDPKTNSYKAPASDDQPTPIGFAASSTIDVDMEATLSGGSAASGNSMVKFRFGEASYFCADDGSCMTKRVAAKAGRAVYSFKMSDFKKNGWIYTDATMKGKGRDKDNYADVYRFEVRHDAEATASATSPCTPSTATFKVYKVTFNNVDATLNTAKFGTMGISMVGQSVQFTGVTAATTVEIMNAQGQVVKAASIDASNNSVNLSALKQGVYFVKGTANGQAFSQKISLM
jgi:hypothetical protein